MTEKQLHEFSIAEIVYDFKAIMNCFQICIHNNVESAIFQVFNPYLCVFVYSGIEYLENHNILNIDDNMAYNYKNFGIQDNPPVLMAFMDILCIVNSYNEVFTKVNIDERLDLKVKFLVFFESIVGIKKLIEFCDSSIININMDDEFKRFVYRIDKIYCRNPLRRYCAHYGYLETDWKSDPVVEVFEKLLNKPIEEISEDLSNQLLKLGEYLNKFIIKVPFN